MNRDTVVTLSNTKFHTEYYTDLRPFLCIITLICFSHSECSSKRNFQQILMHTDFFLRLFFGRLLILI